jgi:DNA-binding FrmR family transcriptional regulator
MLQGLGRGCAVQVDKDVRNDVMRRLQRADGQLRGVMAMLESGRDCVDVLTQVVAVSHAVNGTGFMIIRDGLQQCAAPETATDDDERSRTITRLEKLFLSLA